MAHTHTTLILDLHATAARRLVWCSATGVALAALGQADVLARVTELTPRLVDVRRHLCEVLSQSTEIR